MLNLDVLVDTVLAEASLRDLDLGKDGSEWKHGYIPLNPVAVAMKRHKWHGHGDGGERKGGATMTSERPKGHMPNGDIAVDLNSTARITTKKAVHQGKPGYLISGKDTKGRKVSVFTEDRAEAMRAAANIKNGNDAFAGSTKHDASARPLDRGQEGSAGNAGGFHPAPNQNERMGQGGGIHGPAAQAAIDEVKARQKLDKVAEKYHSGGRLLRHAHKDYHTRTAGQSPMVSGRHIAVEGSRSEHIGKIMPRLDGTANIEDAHGRDLGVVKNRREAIAGLAAAHHMRTQEAAENKAKTEAMAERIRAENKARDLAAKKTVDDAKAADEARANKAAWQAGDKNRRDMADIRKSTRPSNTKTDTPTMQKARDEIGKRLDGPKTDLSTYKGKPADLKSGTPVSYKVFNGQGVASTDRQGFVWHSDAYGVHMTSIHPETGAAEVHSMHAYRGKLESHATPRDMKTDKANFEAERNSHAASWRQSQDSARNHPPQQDRRSVSAMVKAAEAELERRRGSKPSTKNYVGMSHKELTSHINRGDQGAIAEGERRGKNAVRRHRMKAS